MKILSASLTIIVLLTDCAHRAPASQPSSVDPDGWISIDNHPASEPTCNRQAAEILLFRRQAEQQKQKVELLDCNEQRELAEDRAKRASDAEKQATLFGKYGVASSVLAAIVSVLIGFGIGIEIGVRK